MAKIVVQNEIDPGIAIVLEEVPEGAPGIARGTHGTCTQCGWPMHRWARIRAIEDAKKHVDGHRPVLIGGDTDALIR